MTEADPAGARESTLDAVRELTLDALRVERSTARRRLEVARMRARQDKGAGAAEVERLRERAERLTDELIRRYAADLGLVDSLLLEAYPRKVTTTGIDDRRAAP